MVFVVRPAVQYMTIEQYVYISSCQDIFEHSFQCSLSSSCHAISKDILDPLSPFLPIVHCFQQVFIQIGTELLYLGLN